VKRKPEGPARHRPVVQLACEFLAREGCSPRVLLDGAPRFSEILFRYDGGLFVAGVDERNRDFLDVSCAELFDPPPDEVTALRLANAVQGTHKVVKIGVGRDPRLLFFHAPVLLRGLPPTRALLERCVRLLRQAAGDFGDLLRGTTQARA
jgi:hypothetical protein